MGEGGVSGGVCKIHCAALVCFAVAGLAASEKNDADSAFRKLGAIEAGTAATGSGIVFTPAEVRAWIRAEARARVPQGVRDVRIELGDGRAMGYATIDFLKIRQAATGEEAGWLLKNLFAGERPVVVTARFASEHGRARVDVERVQISGIAIEGRTLEFAIEDYLRPAFPDVVVNEWFGLRFGIERFMVTQAGVTVVVRKGVMGRGRGR
jgi:hypothetical protein